MTNIDKRIMECLSFTSDEAGVDKSMMWAAELSDLCRRLDAESRVHRDALHLIEMQWTGVFCYRVGDRVHSEHGLGTVIRCDIEHGETEPGITAIVVRLDRNGELKQFGTEDLEVVTPKTYLNVYLHDRRCGGPEEGGWYYDTYEPVPDMCTMISHPSRGEQVLEEKQKELDNLNKDRRPPSSVLSEGHFVARLEAWPAEPYPRYRPRYC